MENIQFTNFLVESNKIEGILGIISDLEMAAAEAFLALPMIYVEDLVEFVAVIQPDAMLRDKKHLNVRVGNHRPIAGGPEVRGRLIMLLKKINDNTIDAFNAHLEYEDLHPFTDGNGRSGRILWLWQMGEAPLGFLHKFYYQTLDGSRN